MHIVSQYTVNKHRKEMRRLASELASARAKFRSYRRGAYGRHEIIWNCLSLRETLRGMRAWLADVKVEKAIGWSPARRARHGFAPLQ